MFNQQAAALNQLEGFLTQVLNKEVERADILTKRLNAKREMLRLVKNRGG